MLIKTHIGFLALALTTLIVVGCGESPKTVEVKKLSVTNPTSYTFDIPVQKLHDTVTKIFDVNHQLNDPVLKKAFYAKPTEPDDIAEIITFRVETPDSAILGKEYFQKPNTKNDIFLNSFDTPWTSLVYHHKDKSFKYSASFVIQLRAVNKTRTLLSIETLNSEIYNGSKCCGPCFGNYALEQKVKPTTIEEYTLILYIAEKLGVKGLKPLQLPG
ncbi:MAG: hypothetical protein JSU01_21025 [Bacteroidetes bacterium]|nr:hypothetical protein [Bacteroidota bacterium]